MLSMTEEDIQRNLFDAGCDEQVIRRYMAARRSGDSRSCSRLLEERRRALLDEIHGGQKRLDCLDYLRYQLQRKQEEP